MFSRLQLGLQKCVVELVDLLRLALRLGARHAKSAQSRRRLVLGRRRGMLLRALGFDLFCRRSKMPLNFPFFFLLQLLPEDVFVFRIGLREVVEAESLAVF